jgi:hypothetical protein
MPAQHQKEVPVMTGHIDPTKETFSAFRAQDRAGPIHMLNLVRFREKAAYPDGRDTRQLSRFLPARRSPRLVR